MKKNRRAREMLITPNEVFSADRVIEKALRQEIGPDPTAALLPMNFRHAYHND